MGVASMLIRFGNVGLRFLQFCTSIIILGIFGWFIRVLVDNDAPIGRDIKAVVGLSALAALYTLFGIILTFFLGGILFFAMLAVALDVCFVASFIAIAVMARGSRGSCSGNVSTPIGDGPSDRDAPGYGQGGFGFGGRYQSGYRPNLGLACRLQKAVLALAVIGIFLFMCSIVLQLLQARERKREKSRGPSSASDYSSGHEKKKLWHRGRHHDAERGVPNGGANGTARGTTGAGANGAAGEKPGFWKFGRHHQNGGVANGYSDGVPGHAAQPQQQTATYGTGAGGAGAGTAPAGGGQGYSYVNSAPGFNVQQTAPPGQYGVSNY